MLSKKFIAPEVMNNIYDGVMNHLVEQKYTRSEAIAGLLYIVGAQITSGKADGEKLSEYVYDATAHAVMFFDLLGNKKAGEETVN